MRVSRSEAAAESASARILRGTVFGARMGVYFCALALLVFLIGGNAALAAKGHPSIEKLLPVYMLGSSVAGGIGGLVAPLVTNNLRAALVGAVALMPMGVLWRIASVGFQPWTRGDTFAVGFGAFIVGAGGGVIIRRVLLRRTKTG